MYTYEGVSFNIELILTILVLAIASHITTRKWTDPKRIRFFNLWFLVAFTIVFQIIPRVIFVFITK